MALSGIYKYKNADSSLNHNQRSAGIIDRAILDGGVLTYTGSLNVQIAPFIAHGFDGLVVISTAQETLTLTDGQSNYIVCLARYISTGDPEIVLKVVSEVEWLTSVDRNYFITFAKFDLIAGGFASVDDDDADYSVSDYSDKLGKHAWRLPATTVATLPTARNKIGDVRVALSDKIARVWTGTLWQGLGTLAVNVTSTPVGSVSATNVQTAIQQLEGLIAGAASASSVSFTPSGDIVATDVQAALEELDTEKVSVATPNTYTANQAITATGFDTSKLTIENGTVAASQHWAQLTQLKNSLNVLRVNLAGSGAADQKRFQLVSNAAYNSGTGLYTADNAGSGTGRQAGFLRLDTFNNRFTIGYKADTTSSWTDGAWVTTALDLPKTTNLALTVQTDATIAAPSTVVLSDRFIMTSMALVSRYYIPFHRKFTNTPSSVTLSAAGTYETNVASIIVSDITVNGFVITVTPTTVTTAGTPAIFTVDRTWTTVA
jgi:hypothetical protein